MAKSKFVKANQKIAEEVAGGYKTIESTVVGGYKTIESAVVGGYRKIEDAFVDRYLTHDGESVEEAKARLQAKKEERQSEEHSGNRRSYGHAGNCGSEISNNYVQQAQKNAMEHVKHARNKANI